MTWRGDKKGEGDDNSSFFYFLEEIEDFNSKLPKMNRILWVHSSSDSHPSDCDTSKCYLKPKECRELKPLKMSAASLERFSAL